VAIQEILKQKEFGNSRMRHLMRVPLPTPEGPKMTSGDDIVVVLTLYNARISVSVACKTEICELTGLHSKWGCSPLC